MAKTDTPPAAPEQESAGWRPAEGDILSGKIVAITKGWSDWTNAFYPLVTVHDTAQDRDIDLHCFHHTLNQAMMETRPVIGDEIEVVYVGKRPTKDNKRSVAIYRVTFPGATGENVWADLKEQDRRAPAAAAQGRPVSLDEKYGDTLPE